MNRPTYLYEKNHENNLHREMKNIQRKIFQQSGRQDWKAKYQEWAKTHGSNKERLDGSNHRQCPKETLEDTIL